MSWSNENKSCMRVNKQEFVWEFSQFSCPGQTRTKVSWELTSESLYESFLNSAYQWQRQVSEFGGAFEGQHAFWGGGKIEFHEISPPPRCQKFWPPGFFPYIFSENFSRTFLIFFQTFKNCPGLSNFFTDLPKMYFFWQHFTNFYNFAYPTQMFQQHLAIFHKSRPSAGLVPTPMALSD